MAEYIEREALLAAYDRLHEGPPGGARKLIEEAPAADVAPVRHGKWVFKSRWRDSIDENLCSECGQMMTTAAEKRMSYCPNCGARMDGDAGA